MSTNNNLIMFYSADCVHCEAMLPILNDIQQTEGIEVELIEVTPNDPATVEMYERYEAGKCGGVPFFYNTETKRSLCGEVSKEELRDWALQTP